MMVVTSRDLIKVISFTILIYLIEFSSLIGLAIERFDSIQHRPLQKASGCFVKILSLSGRFELLTQRVHCSIFCWIHWSRPLLGLQYQLLRRFQQTIPILVHSLFWRLGRSLLTVVWYMPRYFQKSGQLSQSLDL